ncbi:MAG: hypothetical protein PWR01_2597 [Clostridiales bacterium]|nr:hypothetical protein [Clostridiales bacterium]MDN5281524.1 hypothetical protein [Candidatus Ozemobacter sp.]
MTATADNFDSIPQLPPELIDAANTGALVIFVGAGISRLVGLPGWDGFAASVLQQLVTSGIIDYYQESQIKSISDARKWLSIANIIAQKAEHKIDYNQLFTIKTPQNPIYEHLNQYKCTFVTTNYDKFIAPAHWKGVPEENWRYYERKDILPDKLDKDFVIHLHGCISAPASMVVTTKDYLEHYTNENCSVSAFLQHLFSQKTVLFIGYGLEEVEILEYILKFSAQREQNHKQIFILQGFFDSNKPLFDSLEAFYKESFNAELIGYSLNQNSYSQQEKIIENWLQKLKFGELSLAEYSLAMIDELKSEDPARRRSAFNRMLQHKETLPLFISNIKELEWFDDLEAEGFFLPECNPSPQPVDENSFRIPSWNVVEYLVNASELLKDGKNNHYAEKFLSVMRAATFYAQKAKFSNYRTWWQFSKILLNIPLELIKEEDIEMVGYWLEDRFSIAGIVLNELEAWLLMLLTDKSEASRRFALILFSKIIAVEKFEKSKKCFELRFKLRSHSIKDFIEKTSCKLGEVMGLEAVELIQAAVEKAVKFDKSDGYSYLWRPAIENHAQNLMHDEPKKLLLVALRDCLAGLFKHGKAEFEVYLSSMFRSKLQIIRRLSVYLCSEYFDSLSPALRFKPVRKTFFIFQFKHELWHYLNKNFKKFTDAQKQKVLVIIGEAHSANTSKKVERKAKAYRQLEWLSAIKDDKCAKTLYNKTLKVAGSEPDHPDFSTYFTHGWAGYSSDISLEEMKSMDSNQLIERLNSYQVTRTTFDGPTLEGLVKEFGAFIKTQPKDFLSKLTLFKSLKPVFLCELLNAFKELLAKNAIPELDWSDAGGKLIGFCNSVIKPASFWQQSQTERNMSDRFVSAICELLNSFFANLSDERFINLIEPAKKLLVAILKRQPGAAYKEDSDAMSLAINNPRGHCFRALIDLAVYAKRHSLKKDSWSIFEPVFERELKSPDQTSYDFITILTADLEKFRYLSESWVVANLGDIFDRSNHIRWLCAIKGYSYCNRVYQTVYEFLKEQKTLLYALNEPNLERLAKENIVHKIAIAYLSGLDTLEDKNSLIRAVLCRKRRDELLSLMWLVSQHEDKKDKLWDKILRLWHEINHGLDLQQADDRVVASSLCLWLKFLETIEKDTLGLILTVIPYADEDFNSYLVLEQIARISNNQPSEAAEIWLKMLEKSEAAYPEEAILTALKNIIRNGRVGERSANAICSEYIKKGNLRAQNWLIRAKPEE